MEIFTVKSFIFVIERDFVENRLIVDQNLVVKMVQKPDRFSYQRVKNW
jgi:hypothetical protein